MEDAIYFAKGTTFTCSAFLPNLTPVGFFQDWTLKSQVRRFKDNTDLGLIADLEVTWADIPNYQQLALYFRNTDRWPVGTAELDVLLVSPEGETVRTSAIVFEITRGITK